MGYTILINDAYEVASAYSFYGVCSLHPGTPDDNAFTLEISAASWTRFNINIGDTLWLVGTEVAGPISSISADDSARRVTLRGLTWRGIMRSRLWVPAAGQLAVQGKYTASQLIGLAVQRLPSQFAAGTTLTTTQQSVKFRYDNLYDSLESVCESVGGYIAISYNGDAAIVNFEPFPQTDSDEYQGLSTATVGGIDRVNHVYVLGDGSGASRYRREYYINDDGTYTTTTPAWAGTWHEQVAIVEGSATKVSEADADIATFANSLAPYVSVQLSAAAGNLGQGLFVENNIIGVTQDGLIARVEYSFSDGVWTTTPIIETQAWSYAPQEVE